MNTESRTRPTSMHVLVIATSVKGGGGEVLLRQLVAHAAAHESVSWTFLVGSEGIESEKNVRVIVLPRCTSWVGRLCFDAWFGARLAASLKPDVIFSLQNTVLRRTASPQAVYIHQALPFLTIKRFSYFRRSEFRLALVQKFLGTLIRRSAKRADVVIVQTNWMREQVVNISGLHPSEKVVVIPPVVDVVPTKEEDAAPINAVQFFYPTSAVKYKNLELLNEATGTFKLATGSEIPVYATVSPTGRLNNLKCLGVMSHQDTIEFLRKSILVFPSYAESFGMPLAEARALGCRIVASDLPFAREVLDGYPRATFFDPFDAEDLAVRMHEAVGEELSNFCAPALPLDNEPWELILDRLRSLVV